MMAVSLPNLGLLRGRVFAPSLLAHTCRPSSSRLAFSTSSRCSDVMVELDKQLNPREVIEQKRRIYEEKYGDKLRRKIEA